MGARLQTDLEWMRSQCAQIASEMRCPVHHHDARVEVEPAGPFGYEIEVFTCCPAFAQRVRAAIQERAA